MCSGSEAGSYFRLIDFVYHSTVGSRVIKKKKKNLHQTPLAGKRCSQEEGGQVVCNDSCGSTVEFLSLHIAAD